jgi:murein L,D-transpeptidase YafK
MRIVVLAVVVIIVSTMAWALWPRRPLDPSKRATHVIVHKAQRTLSLMDGSTLLKSYRISLGREPVGPKRVEGDGKTPEGSYSIDYRKADSAFHRALHISYPSAADTAAAASNGKTPGGLIMIHGLRNGSGWIGRLHLFSDWTDGCVAVTDREIEELWAAVPDGTPVELRP